MADLIHLGTPWWALIVRSVVIYAALLAGLRLFGKREVGQFTIFDLVFVLLVANAVQPAMTGPDSSLLGGLIIILALLAANLLVSRLYRIPRLRFLLSPSPTTLVYDGQLVPEAMKKEGIDEDEIMMAVREHGLDSLDEVKLSVLEPDGSISVVGKDSVSRHRPRRRRRFVRRI